MEKTDNPAKKVKNSNEKELKHIGLIGLAPMGYNLAYNLLSAGYTVSLYNRSEEKTNKIKEEYEKSGDQTGEFIFTYSLEEFCKSIPEPRPIFMIVQATAVTKVLQSILPFLSSNDMICDFANSNPEDTQKHAEMIKSHFSYTFEDKESKNSYVARFLGIGISGGTTGARKNGGMMISGHKETFENLKPIFSNLTNSFGFFGEEFALGHFVKYLHNAIEYAIMALLAEFNELCCLIESEKDNLEQRPSTSSILAKINEPLKIYLADVLKKVTDHKSFNKIGRVLKMKGSGQWVYNKFGGKVNIGLIGNAIEQRVTNYNEKEATESGKTHKKVTDNLSELEKNMEDCLLFCLQRCYVEGITILERDTQIVQAENREKLIKEAFRVWKSGCIISGGIIDIVYDHLFTPEKKRKSFENIDTKIKKLVLFAVENDIPSQQITTIFNDLKRKNPNDNQIRIIAGMRDYFGAHGVDINGKWVNLDW